MKKITKIRKRDGRIVPFDPSRITRAIFKAITAVSEKDGKLSEKFSRQVVKILERRFKSQIPGVEDVQDIVEEVLILADLVEVAKAYILYREQRRKIREIVRATETVGMVDQYLKEMDWEVKENANMTYSLQGLNNYITNSVTKKYWLNKIYPPEIRRAVEEGDFHIHDLGTLGPYCIGWDLYDLLTQGFTGVSGKITSKPAKHFRAALGQVVNFLYTLQGECSGAIAFSSADTYLAPFIRYDKLNYQEVKQAMQEFLFNCNVPTRVGFQSLAWKELVVVKDKGKVKFIEIGKLIDQEFEKNSHRILEENPGSYAVQNYDDYQVLSFNREGRAVWTGVKAFIRHKVPKSSNFIKIKTNRGQAFVSRAHSLFSFSKLDGKFNPKPTTALEVRAVSPNTKLKLKNHFVALGELENKKSEEKIDLLQIIEEFPQMHKNIYVKINPTATLNGIRQKILKKYQGFTPFYLDFGFKNRTIWRDWSEGESVRYDVWKRFGEPEKEVKLKLQNSKVYYPRFIKGKDLENFVKLCAWYITEGHNGPTNSFYISQADSLEKKEILDILRALNCRGHIEKAKGYSRKQRKAQVVYKMAGRGLLADMISWSCGTYSFNKVIPWFIFDLNSFYQKLFIQTLLKGDACEYKNHWDFTTTSRKLSLSLSLLLVQNNYRFSIYTEEISKINKNWRDQCTVRLFKKNESKRDYKVGNFEAKTCLGIEEFKYQNEFEYDISVDLPQENFIGGNGLLVFHNTPFTNLTLDLKPPETLVKMPIVIGGKPQKENYGGFQKEMDMFNQALAEVMCEGDGRGRVFTFPILTYNITKDFDWEHPTLRPIWEMTAKFGLPYFSNFINSDLDPEEIRSMCCHLKLDLRELHHRGGGLFGSGALTGSIGVVTIDLPRLGYLSKSEKEFFDRLIHLMDLARESLEIKRKALEEFIEKGLYPYSKFYLRNIKKMRGSYWANHFSTIGLVGMNEALLNFMGENMISEKGREFALKVLNFMRERLLKYQEETDNIYNLEATPAESTSYRLAKKDKETYPDIIVSGKDVPYYTNSTQLPVDYGGGLFEALKLQDEIQTKYTGGTIFHAFLGERISDPKIVKKLIKKIFENFKLPYFTFTPTFSICPKHSYLAGEHFVCPKCGSRCEVYSRIVGYISPLSQWNVGKQEEFGQRKVFKVPNH